ncbi:alpha/beta hydrolase [Rhodobacteraceae bacterium]|nr:alpha/beta hydrolase [Paracoccaceae bacterium]
MRKKVLTFVLLLAAGIVAFAMFTDRRADLREASAEARFPAMGEFVDVNGVKIHVRIKGEGPDLVLIHGASGNIRDMELALGDHLTDRYRVFFVDRPGHGWSDRLSSDYERPFTTQAETLAEQASALSQAVTKLGAKDPIVLGHSYGAAVAMAWGLDHPASALVIVSGAILPWPGNIDFTYRLLGSSLGGGLIAPLASTYIPDSYVSNAVNHAFRPQSAPPDYIIKSGVPLATRIITLRANNRMVNTLRPEIVEQSKRYDELTMPIEILHGTEDKTVYLTIHAEPLAERLDNAHLTPLKGIGHMPHHIVPEAISDAVDRAEERVAKRPSG